MPIHNIDGIIKHLEENASDELVQLESVGAEYYTTEQLLRLRGQWEVKNQLFQSFLRFLIRLAAISPLWIGGWLLFSFLQWKYLALLCLALFPLSFVVFFVGLYQLYAFFRGKGHLSRVGEMIGEELTKRRKIKEGGSPLP